MANFAIVENGLVTNIVLAQDLSTAQECNPGKSCVECTDANPAAIGWAYDGNAFTAPAV